MFFLKVISRIPLPLLYLVSDFFYVMSYYVVRYRRAMVRKHLTRSFPEKDVREIIRIEKKFYRNLCDYGVEFLKLLTMSKESLAKRVRYTNQEVLENYKKNNQSVFLLTAHQFNWEWLVAAGNFALPLPVDFVYQPVRNKLFDEFSLRCRSRFGSFGIKRDQVAREIIKRKNILRNIAIVADQYPGYNHDKKYHAHFLNQDTVFFYGANQLAHMTQYPVVFAQMVKVKRGHYEAHLVPIAHPPYAKDSDAIVEAYVREVEKIIRRYPDNWLWSHNRWKTRHLNQ